MDALFSSRSNSGHKEEGDQQLDLGNEIDEGLDNNDEDEQRN
jgi:hypothetical protein